MIKQHKFKLLISSVFILLPLCISQTVLPLILLLLHWLCIWITWKDPFNKNQNKKISGIVLWIFPVISFYISFIIYNGTHGMLFSTERISIALVSILFILLGNYLPKCKQNYTIGIKITWALNDEENWNRTHRLAGKVWVIGGIVMLFTMFLPGDLAFYALIADMLIVCFIPVIYSYLFYRKKLENGDAVYTSTQWPPKGQKSWFGKFTFVLGIAICAFVAVIMFTGDIEVICDENAFTVEASYWEDLTLDYDSIDKIEYRDSKMDGSRSSGFGSPRLLMGTFQNEEFDYYTRYTYTDCDACIVLESGDDIYVISGKDAVDTKAIYEALEAHME